MSDYKIKTIYVLELNMLNLPIMMIFRLMRNRIRFLTVSPFLQKESAMQKISWMGMQWLSYESIPLDKPVSFWIIKDRFRNILIKKFTYNDTMKKVMDRFRLKNLDNDEMILLIIRKLDNQLHQIAELFMFVDFLEKNGDIQKQLWLRNNIVSRSILIKEIGYVNICPKLWSILESLIKFCYRLFRILFSKIINYFIQLFHKSEKYKIENKNTKSMQSESLNKFSLLYFPHNGIWYGDLFKKDYYYTSSDKSPFHPSKILHMSLGEDKSILNKSIKYYIDNNIPFADWYEISALSIRKSIFIFLCKNIKLTFIIWKEMDFDFLILLIIAINRIYSNCKRLKKFSNLKMVLIGYDILFPLEISLACRILKIKTAAVQERMISSWWTWPFVIDHYFVSGPASSHILKQRFNGLISNSYEIGPIRIDNHLKVVGNSNKSEISSKYKFKVLVLDYHSPNDYYENGRTCDSNWKINLKFYKDILKLCSHFSEAFFIIKGKNHDFINLSYFSEIVHQIDDKSNCLLVRDYKRWTPFTSAASSDITIAMHTSLGDEILALKKPVIFYDYFGFPSIIFDYGKEIIAFHYEDLLEKLKNYFKDPVKYNRRLNPIRKELYNIPVSSPKQLLTDKLLNIYRS